MLSILFQSMFSFLFQICDAPGLCIGVEVGYGMTDDEAACNDLCTANDLCQWYSYDSNGSLCLLTSDCNNVESCQADNCVHGQKDCGVTEGNFRNPVLEFSVKK